MRQKIDLKKQMPKNLGMNILSFIVNILIGIWLLPYLVKHIGVVAYGLIPLAMFFTEYIGIITNSLNNAIGRFLLIELHKRNYKRANEIFNTALVLMLIFGIFQMLLLLIIVNDINFFINVPDYLVNDAIWLFVLTFTGFIFSLFRSIFSTAIYAFNRLDYIQFIRIFQVLLRVLIIVFLFTLYKPSLKFVGLANFFSSLLSFLVTVFLSRKIVPELKIRIFDFKIGDVKKLSSMGIWVLIQQVGAILFLKLDLYIINTYLGSYKAGEYAIIIKLNNIIRAMIGVFAGIISPVILIFYAKKEFDKLIKLSKLSIKMLGIILAIPIAILSALAGEVLTLWVGDEYSYLKNVLILSLFPLIINLAVLPLFSITTAYNKVKLPGIITIIFGVLNFIFSILIVKNTELGIFGVLIVGAVLLTLKNVFFTPIYVAHIINIKFSSFIYPLIFGILAFSFTFIEIMWLKNIININSIFKLLGVVIIVGLINLSLSVGVFFKRNERDMIIILIPKKYRSYFIK